jgi:hypothetical protein
LSLFPQYWFFLFFNGEHSFSSMIDILPKKRRGKRTLTTSLLVLQIALGFPDEHHGQGIGVLDAHHLLLEGGHLLEAGAGGDGVNDQQSPAALPGSSAAS